MADVRKELKKLIDEGEPVTDYQIEEYITDIIRLFDRHLWTMKNRRLLVADYDLEKAVLDSRH